MTNYVFQGITPFVRDVADREGLHSRYPAATVGHQIGKAETSWHLKRLADALGQLPAMKAADRPGKIAYIREVFDSLKLAYLAAEEAIDEVSTAIGEKIPAEDQLAPAIKVVHKKGK